MARPKKSSPAENQEISALEKAVKAATPEKLPIDEMPLTSLREYRLYNEEARKLNKQLKILRYPIKQCPVELHPKQRIKFGRNDQPSNPLPVHLSNHLIHFEQTLIPGQIYDLPECVISHLQERGTPVWKWFDNPDGSKETRVWNKEPRFQISTVYQD